MIIVIEKKHLWFTTSFILVLMALLVYAASGDPSKFLNSAGAATVWIGGDGGIVNASGWIKGSNFTALRTNNSFGNLSIIQPNSSCAGIVFRDTADSTVGGQLLVCRNIP